MKRHYIGRAIFFAATAACLALGACGGGNSSGGGRVGAGSAAGPDEGSVTLYGPANEDLLVIRSIEREGNSVVVKGRAYGTLPLSATLRPEQARRIFKLLKPSLLPFLLGFLFRRSKK